MDVSRNKLDSGSKNAIKAAVKAATGQLEAAKIGAFHFTANKMGQINTAWTKRFFYCTPATATIAYYEYGEDRAQGKPPKGTFKVRHVAFNEQACVLHIHSDGGLGRIYKVKDCDSSARLLLLGLFGKVDVKV